jgi:hypothetical protein
MRVPESLTCALLFNIDSVKSPNWPKIPNPMASRIHDPFSKWGRKNQAKTNATMMDPTIAPPNPSKVLFGLILG